MAHVIVMANCNLWYPGSIQQVEMIKILLGLWQIQSRWIEKNY